MEQNYCRNFCRAYPINILVELIEIGPLVYEDILFKSFFSSILSSDGHFVQWSGTIFAILVMTIEGTFL